MLGFEVSPIVQYVIAFAIVAALLVLFAVVLRRIGGKRFAMAGQDRGRGRQPRLGIVDVYDLDKQRQLVLLRRDNVEHLVMLGGPNDLVVESNIVRVPMGRAPVAEVASERAGQGEVGQGNLGQGNVGQEPGRAIAEASIAAVAAAPVLAAMQAAAGPSTARGAAPRDAEPVLREPAIQQRSQPQVAQPAPQPAAPQPAAPKPVAPQPAPPPIRPQPPAPLADIERSAAAQQSAATSAPIPPVPSPTPSAPAPASPLADLEAVMRAKPRPAEPATAAPSEPKRSLFGFGRATEAPPAPPAFPPRPRATPVAPDFAPQRTPPKFSQTDEKLANAGSPTLESDKAPAARKTDAEPKLSRSLDEAILADMARQLESALERPRSPISPSASPPVALKPAAATPAPPTSSPQNPSIATAVNTDPSEPKSYQPVTTAAAAAGTVAAVASVFRSASTASPTSPVPVPPRPYGGESSPQPSSPRDNREDDGELPEEKTVEAAESSASKTDLSSDAYNEPGPSDAGAESDDVSSIASSEEGDDREQGDLAADDQAVTGSEAGSDVPPAPTSPKPDGNANGSMNDRLQTSEFVEVRSDAAADAETSSVGENADDERRQPAAPVIDPFSVDEIEAEFARLLGRAVDKDPKST